MVSYSFNNALFQDAVLFFASGVITRGLFAYICFVVLATLLAALCACSPDGASSHLLGAAGCWRNAYAAGWADVTLNTLTAFLLGLLVNNVLNRWWTTRVMVQDAINSCAQVLFLLTASLKPRAGREAPELELRDGTLRGIARRLKLAFRILLLSAKTDYSKDRIGVRGAKARRTFVAKEVEDYYDALSRPKPDEPPRSVGRTALLTLEERATLGNKRHAYVVLAWITRDAMALVEGKHVGEARFGDVLAALSKLRALCEDVPMFTRVQLPFVTVALVVRGARCAARSHAHTHTRAHTHAHAHTHTHAHAHTRGSAQAVVVHLTIFQLMYCSASYIAAGLVAREFGLKAFAGLFSITVLPTVYLSILCVPRAPHLHKRALRRPSAPLFTAAIAPRPPLPPFPHPYLFRKMQSLLSNRAFGAGGPPAHYPARGSKPSHTLRMYLPPRNPKQPLGSLRATPRIFQCASLRRCWTRC